MQNKNYKKMKKLLVATLVLMALNQASFAQKKVVVKNPLETAVKGDKNVEPPITKEDKIAFLENKKIIQLQKLLGIKNKKDADFIAEGTRRLITTDQKGKVDIMLLVYNMPNTDKGILQLVMLKNNVTNEEVIWAENEKSKFELVKNEIIQTPLKTTEQLNEKYMISKQQPNGILSCLFKFVPSLSNSAVKCSKCLSGVKPNKVAWKYVASLVWNCGWTCTGILTSTWDFVLCVLL